MTLRLFSWGCIKIFYYLLCLKACLLWHQSFFMQKQLASRLKQGHNLAVKLHWINFLSGFPNFIWTSCQVCYCIIWFSDDTVMVKNSVKISILMIGWKEENRQINWSNGNHAKNARRIRHRVPQAQVQVHQNHLLRHRSLVLQVIALPIVPLLTQNTSNLSMKTTVMMNWKMNWQQPIWWQQLRQHYCQRQNAHWQFH